MTIRTRNFFQPRLIYSIIIIAVITLNGCGGKLVPRELKDFISADLQVERRCVEFQQPFRSEFTLRVNPLTYSEAKQAERDLIESSMKYFRRDNVTNFINDSLIFVVRLDSDPNVILKYWTIADEMRRLIEDEISIEEFISRCKVEEAWNEDL